MMSANQNYNRLKPQTRNTSDLAIGCASPCLGFCICRRLTHGE